LQIQFCNKAIDHFPMEFNILYLLNEVCITAMSMTIIDLANFTKNNNINKLYIGLRTGQGHGGE